MLGKDTSAIAQILGLSPNTVKFHAENAMAKLNCESRHAAVLRAMEYGLLQPRSNSG
jgi:DNA-binding CsgD family transcriptional regulator